MTNWQDDIRKLKYAKENGCSTQHTHKEAKRLKMQCPFCGRRIIICAEVVYEGKLQPHIYLCRRNLDNAIKDYKDDN